MSPEQATGRRRRPPQRHLHVRHRAAGDGDRHAAIPPPLGCRHDARDPARRTAAVAASIGEATDDLQTIIDRCLAKPPDDRYQAMAGCFGGSSDGSPTARVGRTAGRRRTVPTSIGGCRVGTLAVAAVALAAVAAIWLNARLTQSGAERGTRRSTRSSASSTPAASWMCGAWRAPDCSDGLETRGSSRCCGRQARRSH